MAPKITIKKKKFLGLGRNTQEGLRNILQIPRDQLCTRRSTLCIKTACIESLPTPDMSAPTTSPLSGNEEAFTKYNLSEMEYVQVTLFIVHVIEWIMLTHSYNCHYLCPDIYESVT